MTEVSRLRQYILTYAGCNCVGGHGGPGPFPADCVKGQALADLDRLGNATRQRRRTEEEERERMGR